MRTGIFGASAVLLAMFVGAAGARADDLLAKCRTLPAPDLRVQVCGEIAGTPNLSARNRAAALFHRAGAELDLKQEDAAIADLDAALAADPTLWPAHFLRASIRYHRRQYDSAIADFRKVVDTDPTLPEAHHQLGVAYSFAGRPQDALISFDKAISLAGTQRPKLISRILNSRGYADEALGRFADARRDFEGALQRDIGQDDSRGAGRAAYMQGDIAGALKLFGQAYEHDKSDGYLALWLYLAETRAGQDGLARLRDRAAALKPGIWPEPVVRVVLGESRPPLESGPAYPATWSVAELHRAGECELSFFLGEQQLLNGNAAKARVLFQAAVGTGVAEFVEYRLAGHELARMAGDSQ